MKRTYSKDFDISSLDRDDAWKAHVASAHRRLAAQVPPEDRDQLTSCPICRAPESDLFVVVYDFSYRECSACGHIYCSTPPSDAAIKALYTSTDDEKKTIQGEIYLDEKLFHTRVAMIAAPKVEFVTSACPDKGRWVDIGCGAGEVLVAAAGAGWPVELSLKSTLNPWAVPMLERTRTPRATGPMR